LYGMLGFLAGHPPSCVALLLCSEWVVLLMPSNMP
jgi:hypothetical protein